eukprot:scaffold353342_cov22-Prasinocladus_malaysianus.AAC.1
MTANKRGVGGLLVELLDQLIYSGAWLFRDGLTDSQQTAANRLAKITQLWSVRQSHQAIYSHTFRF